MSRGRFENMDRRKKKILLVSHEMTYTGAPRSLLQIAKILKEKGNIVRVWTLQNGEFGEEFRKSGIKVRNINFPMETSESFAEELNTFDLIIANTIFCAAFARYSQRYSKTVLYIREAKNIVKLFKDCNLNEEDLKNAQNIVCVSEYAKTYLCKTYGLDNVIVIHNFMEDDFKKIELRRKSPEVNFLVSGTIEPRKGQDIAIKAFLNLREKERKYVKLHFAGQCPKWSENYYNSLNINNLDGVIYHGEIKDRNKLLKLYKNMDVILIPSFDESCSLVALEVAMLGKMIVLTENTGAKYLVDNSCIIKAGDDKALGRLMYRCMADRDWMYKMGKENRKRYLEEGTREQYENRLMSYLNQIEQSNSKEKKTDEIKVSIVVPVYNVEKYLSTCMDSIINQTLKEIEVICINDGSLDDSLDILKKYQNEDIRVKVITTENHGYGYAVNLGMKEAMGDYIGIVEPDDYIDPQMYEILYHRAISTDSEIVKADFYRFCGQGKKQENKYQCVARSINNYNRIIDPQKEKESFRFIMNNWNGIYRREFIEKYKIYHNETAGAAYQDNGFWFQSFCQAKRVTFINKALYFNRRDNPNSSVNSREKIYCANVEYDLIKDFLDSKPKLKNEFIFQYSMKKYHTYLFTLDRIGWEYKEEYLRRFSEEFSIAEQNGELSQAVFTPQEWSNMHWIIRDVKDYFEKKVKSEISVSVVVPVYNAEKYLFKCLTSLEKQTFRKIEIICINDGSTDHSEDIINSFVMRDRRFLLYNQKNRGAGAARNKGLLMARGEYIIFLDADDFFSPELIHEGYTRIREFESEICVIGSYQYDEKTGNILPCDYSLQIDNYPDCRPFQVSNMEKNPFRCFVGWAWDKLYLRSFLLNNDLMFQELRTSNDMYFTYMSLFKASKITTLEKRCIYQRRNVAESLSMTRDKSWKCFLYALQKMQNELKAMGLYEDNKINFANYALHSCLWNIQTLSDENAQKLLAELKKKWFRKLEISSLMENEFEYRDEYEYYRLLLEHSREGICICKQKYEENLFLQRGRNSYEPGNVYIKNETYYQFCLDEIRKSKSYKIGRAITWLPRKIRGW